MSREIVEALRGLEQEKGIDAETLMAALEDALLSAYKKSPGAAKYARVDLDRNTADFRVYELILPPELEEQLLAQAVEAQEEEIDPETGELREPEDPELDPEMLRPYEDQIQSRDVTPDDFGRIAAQTAKQVILQRIREAERQMMYDEYQDRVGELITGIIQQSDNRYTLVQLRERVEALLPRSEQVWNERYDHGMRVKAVITDVSAEGKGPSIVVSRRNPELIKELFELEVPEIADGLVEIVGVAREPGYRSKIAVISHADGVDPVGACVGPRGPACAWSSPSCEARRSTSSRTTRSPPASSPRRSPARVREVLVDDDTKEATVIVPDDQLSLAIGREGQNARLAAKLTGWKVDIKSQTEFSESDEIEYESESEEGDGRCAAVLGRAQVSERRARGLALLRPAPAPGAGALRHQPGNGPGPARRRGGGAPRRPRRGRGRRVGAGRARGVRVLRAGRRGRGRRGRGGGAEAETPGEDGAETDVGEEAQEEAEEVAEQPAEQPDEAASDEPEAEAVAEEPAEAQS